MPIVPQQNGLGHPSIPPYQPPRWLLFYLCVHYLSVDSVHSLHTTIDCSPPDQQPLVIDFGSARRLTRRLVLGRAETDSYKSSNSSAGLLRCVQFSILSNPVAGDMVWWCNTNINFATKQTHSVAFIWPLCPSSPSIQWCSCLLSALYWSDIHVVVGLVLS